MRVLYFYNHNRVSMKYEVGDTVLLLHSLEEGVIVEILNPEMVVVNVQGVTFPVYVDQLDFPYFKRFSEKKQPSKRKPIPGDELPREKKKPAAGNETGLWLSFLPVYRKAGEEEMADSLKMYLLNETNLSYHFHYRLYSGGKLALELKNELLRFSHFYLQDILIEDLNDNPRFDFHFTLVEPSPALAQGADKSVRLKPKQLFTKLAAMQQHTEAVFRILLFDKYPERTLPQDDWPDIEMLKEKQQYSNETARSSPRYEVDLHIGQLMDDYRGLSNFEILTIQLREFQHYLDLAIAHHLSSMIVIHGIGKGKLRDEVHEILRHTPQVKHFINQYDPRYGYGATEIFFEL